MLVRNHCFTESIEKSLETGFVELSTIQSSPTIPSRKNLKTWKVTFKLLHRS